VDGIRIRTRVSVPYEVGQSVWRVAVIDAEGNAVETFDAQTQAEFVSGLVKACKGYGLREREHDHSIDQ